MREGEWAAFVGCALRTHENGADNAPSVKRKRTRLLQHDQLAVHVRRMQLTFDLKHADLISSEFDRLRLPAVHYFLDLEVGNRKTVIRRLRLDVIDHLDLHGGALVDHQSRRNEHLATFVLDIDHGKLLRAVSTCAW